MPSTGLLLLLLLFAYHTACQGLSINLITPDSNSINMYNSGQYNSLFIVQTAPFNCSMNTIYTYSQSSPQYQQNTPYTIQFFNLASNISFTLKSIYKYKFTPTLSASSCSNVIST